ncbi:hypothetical protein ABZ656_44595 [Streptomyces sp. NPDC007095]|uniref:hypothetical protein n=1 Tax=Streptomyces sp. NPDC007095 TaxID=3154482 RepID=UPI0033FD58A6
MDIERLQQAEGPWPSGEIWIADMARVVTSLGVDLADHVTLTEIAELLGMQMPAPVRRASQTGAPHSGAVPPSPQPPPPARPSAPATESASPAQPFPDEPTPLLTPLSSGQSEPRAWAEPALALQDQQPAAHPAPYEPLLPPSSEAATLHAVLSRIVFEGPVDLERLLDLVAENAFVTELPRRPVRTLRFGVQLLVDLGEGMQPFLRDEMEILERVAAIAGRHSCEVRYFTDCPLHRCGEGAGWTWKPYRPPASGAKVLVLSDFGQHGNSGGSAAYRLRRDWEAAVDLMRRNGCLPAALAPMPPDRFPAWLTSLMPVLSWDRTTTTARALIGLS